MKLHVLQHVPFEDAANIGVWALEQGFTITTTHLYLNESLPDPESIDMLVIMGGPMNIYQHDLYPWLVPEKQFIKAAIEANCIVLGVCLGSQLICDALGGKVTRNEHTEIGWFPVTLTEAGQNPDSLLHVLGSPFEAFHWHGDTFSIPPGAIHLAFSEACAHQAFQYGDRVLGMQFHLDYSQQSIQTMVDNCADELIEGPYVQTDHEHLIETDSAQSLQSHLVTLLSHLITSAQ